MTVRVVDSRASFARQPFAVPLRLSSGTIVEITEAQVEVTVEANGRRAVGRGAIYLSDLWAWPDPTRSHAERDAAMRAYVQEVARRLPDAPVGHPLEIGLQLHHAALADDALPPPLARLVCASPFDAAVHDAAGKLAERPALDLYDDDAPTCADSLFPGNGAVAAVRSLLQRPTESLAATLVVGVGEALTDLSPWVTERGYTVFKIKLSGADPIEDAARTAAVWRDARRLGVAAPRLSVDANCRTADADAVTAYLDALQRDAPEAYAALESVEQPTGRDIAVDAFDWRPVSARKPLLLDEGLLDFDKLALAEAQGWNGVALKTCKGHSFALVAAAWAHRRSWTLGVMDLTNPGIAAVHSALLAARLPGVDTVELNAAQFTPAAHAPWLPRLAKLLTPVDGRHRLPTPEPVGLGTDF